jgi:hypothetical protein
MIWQDFAGPRLGTGDWGRVDDNHLWLGDWTDRRDRKPGSLTQLPMSAAFNPACQTPPDVQQGVYDACGQYPCVLPD